MGEKGRLRPATNGLLPISKRGKRKGQPARNKETINKPKRKPALMASEKRLFRGKKKKFERLTGASFSVRQKHQTIKASCTFCSHYDKKGDKKKCGKKGREKRRLRGGKRGKTPKK